MRSDGLFFQTAHQKDVQWSDTGVASANKFLQKIWNLNNLILNRKENISDKKIEKKIRYGSK